MLAILAMLAPKVALRVASGGCAPPIPCVARHGRCGIRPGRESRRFDRTGKRVAGRSRPDDVIALRIERDGRDRRPIACPAAPPPRIGPAGLLVEVVSGGEQGPILSDMALRRGHISDAAVAVFVVVLLVAGRRQSGRICKRLV